MSPASAWTSMLESLFRDEAMQSVFAGPATLRGMLKFEAALARAGARCGVMPASASDLIAAACDAGIPDVRSIARAGYEAGNPAIPLVGTLTSAVAAVDPDAARWVHWGATSQDVIDTGLVLQLRDAFCLLDERLGALVRILARRVREERETLMAGRTWMQQAVPITFGLKAAGWLDALVRERTRLRETRSRVLVLQFGGAAGTLGSLGDRGTVVADLLAEELGLALPALPWHAHRDRVVEAGAVVGLVAGTLGKIARDISLLMQTEIAEAFEPVAAGRGGSSSMPQKRNPVGCAVALQVAHRTPGLIATLYAAMPQEHERGLGNWPAEWETLPEIFNLTAGSLAAMTRVIDGLEVDRGRMRRNLDTTDGLPFAEQVSIRLATHVGRQVAHEMTGRACRRAVAEQRSLQAVLGDDPEVTRILSVDELAGLFDPYAALGATQAFIDRVLALATDGDNAP